MNQYPFELANENIEAAQLRSRFEHLSDKVSRQYTKAGMAQLKELVAVARRRGIQL